MNPKSKPKGVKFDCTRIYLDFEQPTCVNFFELYICLINGYYYILRLSIFCVKYSELICCIKSSRYMHSITSGLGHQYFPGTQR